MYTVYTNSFLLHTEKGLHLLLLVCEFRMGEAFIKKWEKNELLFKITLTELLFIHFLSIVSIGVSFNKPRD